MADTFHIMGEDLFFRAYHVAKLLTAGVPVTVRDAVMTALEDYHPDAIDPADVKELHKECDDLREQNYDLTERVSELERELEDARDTVAQLNATTARLEEELAALEAKAP